MLEVAIVAKATEALSVSVGRRDVAYHSVIILFGRTCMAALQIVAKT
jgi:hypothetical protein